MVNVKPLSIEETNRALKRKRIWGAVWKHASKVFIFIMLALVYAPLVYISIYSFTDSRVMGEWGDTGFMAYVNLFTESDGMELLGAARNTALVALISTAIAVLLGTLGAIGIFYSRNKLWKNSLQFMNQIPIVNAEIVTAFSLLVFFVQILNLQTSLLTLCCARWARRSARRASKS